MTGDLPYEMVRIKDNITEPRQYIILEELITCALLDKSSAAKQNASDQVKKNFAPYIHSAFVGDNEILIRLYNPQKHKTTVVYLCDVPKKYKGEAVKLPIESIKF